MSVYDAKQMAYQILEELDKGRGASLYRGDEAIEHIRIQLCSKGCCMLFILWQCGQEIERKKFSRVEGLIHIIGLIHQPQPEKNAWKRVDRDEFENL